MKPHSQTETSSRQRCDPFGVTAFTLTELLVVIAILTLLVVTQLPALTRPNVPSRLAQCKNNCRQMAQATMLYRADNSDNFPNGPRITSMYNVDNPTGWPMVLLTYLGGHTPSNQPPAYFCPSETSILPDVAFQLHYQANRDIICDVNDCPTGNPGAKVRHGERYWMFMEKSPSHYASIKTGALITDYMMGWNTANSLGSGMRRHNGGLTAVAADGHVEWLRMPPYQPNRPSPLNFVELGDCYTPPNGQSYAPYWSVNSPAAKLFCRNAVNGPL